MRLFHTGNIETKIGNKILGIKVVLMVKNLPANAKDTSLILGSGRSPGEENATPLQYSCL